MAESKGFVSCMSPNGMPGVEKFYDLFRSNNLFQEIEGLGERLCETTKGYRISSILLDNSTVEYALEFIADKGNLKSPVIPKKGEVYTLAVYELINAIILYENIYVGPGAQHVTFFRDDLAETQKLLKNAEELLDWESIFSLLNLSRNQALNLLGSNPDIILTLESLVGAKLNHKIVRTIIEKMEPKASYESPHYWEKLFAKGIDSYYFFDLSYGFLGANTIAMNAIDPSNASKRWGGAKYFSYTAKRGSIEFPEKGIHEFYAASLLIRSLFYIFVSDLTGLTYRGDALRSKVIKSLIKPNEKQRRNFADSVISATTLHEKERDKIVNEILGYDAFEIKCPLVVKAVLEKAESFEDILKVALDLRKSKEAKNFRLFSATVDEAIDKGKRDEVERALDELSFLGIKVLQEIKVDNTNAPLQVTEEIVKYGSPLIYTLWPLLRFPIEKVYKKLRHKKLAFLDTLGTLPRRVGSIECELENLRAK